MPRIFRFQVNGRDASATTDEDRPLLDVLREDLGLTGTKYGCGEGECGACSVLVDGELVRSCITTLAEVEGRKVETIEGLADGDNLSAVQEAFIDCQAMQCGYCVPGQIIAATALVRGKAKLSRAEIVDHMSGNICRCCNYENILAAVEQAAGVAAARD